MFAGAESFNQPLDMWNVLQVTFAEKIFYNSRISKSNYCKLFTGTYASKWTSLLIIEDLGLSYTCP